MFRGGFCSAAAILDHAQVIRRHPTARIAFHGLPRVGVGLLKIRLLHSDFSQPGIAVLPDEPDQPAALSTTASEKESQNLPASAFPADTLFYVEINRLPTNLDRIGRMDCWPEVQALMVEISNTPLDKTVVQQLFLSDLTEWQVKP